MAGFLKLLPCNVLASFFIMEELQGPLYLPMGWGGVGKMTYSSANCEQLRKTIPSLGRNRLGVKRKVRKKNDMITLGRALDWLGQSRK